MKCVARPSVHGRFLRYILALAAVIAAAVTLCPSRGTDAEARSHRVTPRGDGGTHLSLVPDVLCDPSDCARTSGACAAVCSPSSPEAPCGEALAGDDGVEDDDSVGRARWRSTSARDFAARDVACPVSPISVAWPACDDVLPRAASRSVPELLPASPPHRPPILG